MIIRDSRQAVNQRHLRRTLILRWLILFDQLSHLERAIRSAPKGTFTESELVDAMKGLDNAWEALQNHRPLLPSK